MFLVCHYTAFLFSTRAMTTLGRLPNAHRDMVILVRPETGDRVIHRGLTHDFYSILVRLTISLRISVDGVLSYQFSIDYGVPKGSCLGPLLFVIYSSQLFNIVNKHLPNVHAYADDTQLYLAFKPGDYAHETAAV